MTVKWAGFARKTLPTNPALLEVGGKSRRTLPLHKHEFTMCIGCKFKRQNRLGLRVEKIMIPSFCISYTCRDWSATGGTSLYYSDVRCDVKKWWNNRIYTPLFYFRFGIYEYSTSTAQSYQLQSTANSSASSIISPKQGIGV